MRSSVLLCWLLLVLALVAGCGPARPATTPSATIAALSKGASSTPSPSQTPSADSPRPNGTQPAATDTPTPTGAWIRLSPDAGPPGTSVEIQGYLPGARVAVSDTAHYHGDICWARCPDGLRYEGAEVQWSTSEPGHFTMQLAVPAAPWIDADGVHPLTVGDYPIGVQCLAVPAPQSKGPGFVPCNGLPPQATATFHLTGPTPSNCLSGPCGELSLSPAVGPPGTLVQVRGWAPLPSLIIGDRPFGYNLALGRAGETSDEQWIGQLQQNPDGTVSGSFRVPVAFGPSGQLTPGSYTLALQTILNDARISTVRSMPGLTITPLSKAGRLVGARVELAPTSFVVTASPSWASLGTLEPLWIQTGGFDQPLFVDPTNPKRLAYCASGAIRVSTDGGARWTSISTTGVPALESSAGFTGAYSNQPPPRCSGVALDPGHPGSLYASFGAFKGSPPPIYYLGFVTTDGGRTWRQVPTPSGFSADQFGGFQVAGHVVQALFGGGPSIDGVSRDARHAAEQTADGGRNWAAAALTCLGAAPCVRWGPAPSGIGSCAMHAFSQAIEVSRDAGRSWTVPAWPSGANACNANQLVVLGPDTVALLTGGIEAGGPYPFRLSRDGGATWEVIALPPLPGQDDSPASFQGLQMLPNGALIARTSGGEGWELLPPGASAWCPARGLPAGVMPGAVQAAGDRIWWLGSGSLPVAEPRLGRAPLPTAQCGR